MIALTNLSVPLARQGRTQAALEVVERAVAIDPENLVARFRLATQLVEMGQADKAVAAYREVLNRAPDHPATLERLAELLPADGRANLESNIRSALKKVAKPSEDRASLFFALAKVMEATGNSTEMRRSLARANDEMRRLSPYDPVADDRITRRILARYPSEMAVSTETQDGPFPIFILGLPRSGTTLAEAILGRHPDITPLGEQGTLGFLVQDIINNDLPFTDMDAVRLRLEERRLLPDMPEGTRAYTDKMPENYRIIGMLRQVHPQARIIHITRDPRDVALSMWKSHLSGTALSYTFDLTAMAAKFNLYAETMAHWHHVLPGQILNLPYADMVGDVVAASHRIADFCGVDWVEPMSRPDQATAQIMTASATQLRRPVHTQSVGKWQQEASLLVPFTEALDPVYWGDFIA